MTIALETRVISSLEKVFPDEELAASPFRQASAFRNETFSFQVAYRSGLLLKRMKVEAAAALQAPISLRAVGLVPSEMPVYPDHDDNVVRTKPGLYPDPLLPPEPKEGWIAPPGQWRSVWVTVELDGRDEPGEYPIEIRFIAENGTTAAAETFTLDVLPAWLPEQRLLHTEWFHTDCIATYYGVDVFSERHWSLIESFMKTAAGHGINTIYTPLFTPPLDTDVGGERPTVQLVDVWRENRRYRFGFDKLNRWLDLAERIGFKVIEFSHLYTQWGARHAPKIVAVENGEEKRIFGWETDAAGPEYRAFLEAFLSELLPLVRERGLQERCLFHLSDEPSGVHLEMYRSVSEWTKERLGGLPTMDALSDRSFYDNGLVQHPVPANNHIEPFLEAGVPGLWTYYCCSQYKDVSNRFFSMPSARNRILGFQLYKYRIAGFLHWGYNFYYSQYSRFPIDPFRVTDAYYAFPSGDAFLVYPGPEGPIESIRLEVLYEALQDLRALEALEAVVGRGETLRLLEEGLDEPITFSRYPRDAAWLLAKREQINRAAAEAAQRA